MTRKIHIVGNWKMNQTTGDIKNFFSDLEKMNLNLNCESWLAPQSIHIPLLQEIGKGALKNFQVGSQNCSHKESGAFTGDLSPVALKDVGVGFTLVGHSERRAFFKEGHEVLNEKAKLALDKGLKVIFCVGETLEEREADKTETVVKEQLDKGLAGLPKDQLENVIIAYEPVWAIGTGKTASPEQAQDVHAFVRNHSSTLGFAKDDVIILYGGSVKPSNVDELLSMSDIDGALVGGASLKADDYSKLCIAGSK